MDGCSVADYKEITYNGSTYIFDPSDLEVVKLSANTDVHEVCEIITRKKRNRRINDLDGIGNKKTNPFFDKEINVVSLDIAHGCTLRCKYCYLTAGNIPRQRLSKEAFLEILDFLSPNKGHKMVFYFAGEGEPTMNFELLRQIPVLCREKGFNNCAYEITTNGTLLTREVVDFFKKENFAVSVSLDGNMLNNSNRVFPDGRPSFGVVFNNIKLMRQLGVKFACKSVITPENRNLLDLSKFFNDNEIPFYIGFATRSFNGEYIPKLEDVEILRGQLNIVIDYYKERIRNNLRVYSRKIIGDLRRIHYRITTTEACSAALNSFFIDIHGDIYSCSCHNSSRDISVGNIKTGIDYEKIRTYGYYPKNVEEYSSCRFCWLRYLCSGSCMASKWIESQDTDMPSKYLCAIGNVYWESIIKLYVSIYPYIRGNINFLEK